MKAFTIPPYLREGDRISIITPASHIEGKLVLHAEKLLRAFEKNIHFLMNLSNMGKGYLCTTWIMIRAVYFVIYTIIV